MAISPNTRVGRYEILSLLGEGGMGEVYRARDTQLGRIVAVKVLPSSCAGNPERLLRFELEACAAGALNHPNILAIHDVGTHDGTPYVVSELLEGETLREQSYGTALPVRKAVDYALQITHGLTAAHDKGIVHRDLKPENLIVTKEGRVKILDFGLAKLTEPVQTTEPDMDVPTLRVKTNPGAIIGTIGYMSPEQVRGKSVDHRSDIFSLGVILYEMLTGIRAFRRDSEIETLNAILTEDPPELTESNSRINPALERVVLHCLEKSPDQRFQSARDVAFALEALSGLTSPTREQLDRLAPSPTRFKKREVIAWALAAAAIIAALSTAVLYFRRPPADAYSATRFLIYPPEKASFEGSFAVSPDGRRVALRVSSENKVLLWIRDLDSLVARALPGTEDPRFPFWSPDSRFIAFTSERKLKKIEVTGGPAQTLCDAADDRGGTWNREGVIVLSMNGVLHRVPATGGTPTPLTTLNASRKEVFHAHPRFLPDGIHFLFLVSSAQRENTGIYVGSLDSKETTLLVNANSSGAYAPPGYLLFLRERSLMAQRFDPSQLKLAGEPFPVAEQLDRIGATAGLNLFSLFAVSENGVLVYRSGTFADTQLTWFDRAGKQVGTVGPPGAYFNPSLSRDEKRVAVGRVDPQNGTGDIWLIESARGTPTRYTFDLADESHPIWSPDNTRIAFGSDRDGPRNLYEKSASGVGNDEVLLKSENRKVSNDWSADGQFLLYQDLDPKTNWDLWVLPLAGDRKPFPYLQTEFAEQQGQFSPNGKWITYTSNESGTWQVYVQSFPPSAGKFQVSTDGGAQPQWRRDVQELFYISLDRKLMAVEVKGDGSTFEFGVPKVLFEMRVPDLPGNRNYYLVSADGLRFLVTSFIGDATATPFTVVLNWTSDLKR